MDKNTITGFVLIGIVLFAFSWFNRPTPEQIEAQRRYQDSLAQIELAQQMEVAQKERQAALLQDSINNLPDSVRMQNMRQRFGDFAQAMAGEERQVTIENEVLELRVSNKGGRIVYARLKEYDDYQGQPLVRFDEQDSELNFSLVTADNRVVNTSDLFFAPVQQGDNGLTMRLAVGEAGYLDFVYTLTPNDYVVVFHIKWCVLIGLLSRSTRSLDMVWTQYIRQ